MPSARIPLNEPQRLKSLLQCRILDTESQEEFDNITRLAARLCEAPIGLISLVDADRQWFKSATGIDETETHRDSAFCAHAILGTAPLVINDAAIDPRTCDNPLVLGPPHIRFYAGVPLTMQDGHSLGTLCVIDTVPRDISDQQISDLRLLATQVVSQLELRKLNSVLNESQSQLQEIHTRLNEIATQVPGVVYQFELRRDGTSCFPYASEGLRKIYRVAPDQVKESATAIFSRLHPDDYNQFVRSIEISARELAPWRHEYRVQFSDGEIRWHYGNATPSRLPNGSVLWHGFITDETDQRNARDEAMLTRARMQAVVQGSTQVSIIATDLNGHITVFNSGAERLLGYRTKEMIGRTAEALHLNSELEARSEQLSREYGYSVNGFETFVHNARLGGHSESDCTYVCKDGSHVTVRLVVTTTRDKLSKITGFVCVAADVTDARKAEEDLRFQRERLEMALTGGELGTWDWNIQTGEEIWDTRFADLLGERLEDLSQTFDEFKRRVHPDDLEAIEVRVQRHLEGETPLFEAEFRIRQKNGDWKWVLSRGMLMQHDEHGLPLRMLGTIADISVRKKSEEELVNARVLADAANRSKSEFLANVSHEIRTPLTSILGYADLLSTPGLSEAEIAENVATINSAGCHLLTIINDVLDLSKIEAGKMTIERIETSPTQIMKDVVSVLQATAHAKGLELDVQCRGPVPAVIISDPVRVRQILMNLVGNAIKFTERGRVCLTVEVVPRSADGIQRLAFEVSDTGIGISEDQCKAMFEPFMQADPSTTRNFGGTGLGLSICRRMAEILDGEITVVSELGQGSVFRVTLASGPLTNENMVNSIWPDEDRNSGDSDNQDVPLFGHILIAEDNPVNRRLVESVLSRAGATIDLAENGQIALERGIVAMNSPAVVPGTPQGYDLILMDMQMPVCDGYSATRQLREAGYQGPIIALTAHAMAEDREKCLASGCDDFATKPLEKNDLIGKCREWIERGRAMRLCVDAESHQRTRTKPAKSSRFDPSALMESLSGDIELLHELIDAFNSSSTDLLDEIQHCLETGNDAQIAGIAHALKGSVTTFEADGARDAAAALESLATTDDPERIADGFVQLKSEVHALMLELSEIRNRDCGISAL